MAKCEEHSTNTSSRGQLYLIKLRDKTNPLESCDEDGSCRLYLNDGNKEFFTNTLNKAGVKSAVIGKKIDDKDIAIILDQQGNVLDYNENLDVSHVFCFKKYQNGNNNKAKIEVEFKSRCLKNKCHKKKESSKSFSDYHSNSISSCLKSRKEICIPPPACLPYPSKPKPCFPKPCKPYKKSKSCCPKVPYCEETNRKCPLLNICKTLKCSSCLQPCNQAKLIKIVCVILKKECGKSECKPCQKPKKTIFCDKIQRIIKCLVNELCHCSNNNGVISNKPYNAYTNIPWEKQLKVPKSLQSQQKNNGLLNPFVYDTVLNLPDKSDDKHRRLRSAKIMTMLTGRMM